MIAQFDLFAAPPPAPPSAGAAASPPKRATVAKPRSKSKSEPAAPPCVIAEPQLPPIGALAKIGGHWHQWKKVGVIGEAMGWEKLRPHHHAAHASEQAPRLKNGAIAEPYPAPATVHFGGHTLRVEWSEYGFGIYSGERFLRHFSEVAGCAVAAAEIARADEHFQERLAAITDEPKDEPGDHNEDAIAEQEFEAECPEDAREDDPADDEPPVAQPPASEMPRDELGERLIAEGLAPSAYLLDLNRSLSPPHDYELPAPWNLPSRLFRFPIETNEARVDRDGQLHPRTIGLMHPLLGEHPWVQEVEQRLGLKLDPNGAPNPYGYTNTRNALWWHAVDLISAGMWRELLQTREFTTDDDIIGAVAYGLDYGPHEGRGSGRSHLTVAEAQEILRTVGAALPTDGSVIEALRAVDLTEFKGENGKPQRAINWSAAPRLARAWARIAGIERGWFKAGRSGFLKWTDKAKAEQRNLKIAAGEKVAAVAVPEGQLL
jgi:hypothetical protein